jgi:hypothetical protein
MGVIAPNQRMFKSTKRYNEPENITIEARNPAAMRLALVSDKN